MKWKTYNQNRRQPRRNAKPFMDRSESYFYKVNLICSKKDNMIISLAFHSKC